MNRIMIAAPSSGSGKTTATCALLTLLKRKNLSVTACKCGPDYIDPMFHSRVLGIPCTNLDPFFCDGGLLRHLLAENAGEDITVIEGVMGYYDGTGDSGSDNSSFTVAKETATPVILVVDAKGAAASLLAVIEGFLNYAPESNIKGVLFNRMTKGSYEYVSRLMKDRFGDKVLPVGYIPALPKECILPSRHLGLVTAGELDDLQEILNKTAGACADTIDLGRILEIAGSAKEITGEAPEISSFPKIKIAAAYDDAFCFYYKDTFRLFEKMGAEIAFFSPLDNEPVPEGASGLLIGGGYPELYEERLEESTVSRESVRNAILSGMPVIAECGGFQYLGDTLEGHKMCGVLTHESTMQGRLVRFGYITLTSLEGGLLGPAGTEIKGHEFHYFDSTDNGDSFAAVKPDGRSWKCAFTTDTMYAGYPHLFLYSYVPAAESFYRKCLEYKEAHK